MNDDLVQPDRGFGAHGHRDAEICTYVVRGDLTHADSMGTRESLGPGSIQFMTAGTGVEHSEHNLSKSNDLRFIQMWLTPRQNGLQPNYGSHDGSKVARKPDQWHHLVSDVAADFETPVKINTDANMYVAVVSPGGQVELPIFKGRQAYMLCVEGGARAVLEADQVDLSQHDALEVHAAGCLLVAARQEGAHVLVVEMAQDGRSGRGDL